MNVHLKKFYLRDCTQACLFVKIVPGVGTSVLKTFLFSYEYQAVLS